MGLNLPHEKTTIIVFEEKQYEGDMTFIKLVEKKVKFDMKPVKNNYVEEPFLRRE